MNVNIIITNLYLHNITITQIYTLYHRQMALNDHILAQLLMASISLLNMNVYIRKKNNKPSVIRRRLG